jgi:alkanesulfonate monooxygenase SsuD/methylene tetrahydromethanopterin reductase-like flavin-dependent oxidoreductase (luciferase family)
MQELVAQHADAWNTAWHGVADTAVAPVAGMRAVCERVGRDPSTLQITVGVSVAYPELGQGSRTAAFLSGSAAEIADALQGYVEMGVAHVIVEVAPFTPEAIDRFAEALRVFRQPGGA